MVGRAAGVEYNNIPYDGGGPALLAVLGGNADGSFLFTAQLLPQIAAGKMRALASPTRAVTVTCPMSRRCAKRV
jgi:tripartite-type tricarboxylate transporter receptor subunit TctC